jgi:hypothetical protein
MTGPLIESADQVSFTNKMATDVEPVRSRLLLWALWLFLLDVALRKLDYGLFRKKRVLQPATLPVAAPIQKLKMRKTEIDRQRPAMIEIGDIPEDQPPPDPDPSPPQDSDYMRRLKYAKKKRQG